MIYWPGTNTPKSTGNAFDLSIPRPSGLDTPAERVKAKRLGVDVCESFQTIKGLSKKAQQALKVPSRRVGISIEKSPPARIKRIPQAQRS
jgi:hypothetical protein